MAGHHRLGGVVVAIANSLWSGRQGLRELGVDIKNSRAFERGLYPALGLRAAFSTAGVGRDVLTGTTGTAKERAPNAKPLGIRLD
jgi:hypothetical protein